MTTIFKTIAGSRLYGTHTPESDTDYKAVHLPTKREILLGNRKMVKSGSTGQTNAKNTSEDIDVESFELQRFLKLASDMQTIPVELLFVMTDPLELICEHYAWDMIVRNRDKILSNNPKSFVGYCKSQAVKYSMRGDRLKTFIAVHTFFERQNGMARDRVNLRGMQALGKLLDVPGVTYFEKNHNGKMVMYLDVYGRQVPDGVMNADAEAIYGKPVQEAGRRANEAMQAGGADLKALYHSVRIVDQGITLFRDGIIEFPAQNRQYLMRIRAGELEMDAILDHFDEKLEILEGIGDKSPLSAAPDYQWMDDFVAEQYEKIVRA